MESDLDSKKDLSQEDANKRKSWYQQGLRFECTQCGKCCTGSPGYVWLKDDEIDAIAAFLQITRSQFCRLYTRSVNSRIALVELKKNYDCIFLDNKKCRIYPVRPSQCRTFPWWPQNLSSETAWKETAEICEGIKNSAPVVDFETIEEQKLIQIRRQTS